MKFKRFFVCFLVMAILANCGLVVGATEIIEDDMDVIVHDQEKNEEINKLFTLRNQLELDFEANEAKINQIDDQLKLLGVENISYGEVLDKLGYDALPLVDFVSTATTQWTSRRVVVTYNGKQFELQILEGVPISGSSPLRKNYANVQYEAKGVVAGITAVLKVLGANTLGGSAVIGEKLSAGVSFLSLLSDAAGEIKDALSTSTIIDNVEGTAEVALIVHMKYTLVKPYGSEDEGNQVTCYVGNTVSYSLSTLSTTDVLVDGELVTFQKVETENVEDYSQSAYYNDLTLPAKNYYDYKYNGNTSFTDWYIITSVNIEIFGKNCTFSVPHELPDIVG